MYASPLCILAKMKDLPIGYGKIGMDEISEEE
jgi:hypothetical protein